MKECKSYDYSKLRGRIREKCGTQEKFAKSIKRSKPYLSNVLNGQAYFSQNDIVEGAKVLDIPVDEIGLYFFTIEVHKNETKNALTKENRDAETDCSSREQ